MGSRQSNGTPGTYQSLSWWSTAHEHDGFMSSGNGRDWYVPGVSMIHVLMNPWCYDTAVEMDRDWYQSLPYPLMERHNMLWVHASQMEPLVRTSPYPDGPLLMNMMGSWAVEMEGTGTYRGIHDPRAHEPMMGSWAVDHQDTPGTYQGYPFPLVCHNIRIPLYVPVSISTAMNPSCYDTPSGYPWYVPAPSISTAVNPSCYDTPSGYPCTYQSLPFPLLWTHHVMTRHQDTPVRTSPFHFHCCEPIMLWHTIRIPLEGTGTSPYRDILMVCHNMMGS